MNGIMAGQHNKQGFVQEFKEFAVRGSVMDLAVGVIIGGAFGKIVSSLVADVIMPPIGILLGGVNFAQLKHTFHRLGPNGDPLTWNYGVFIQNVVDFLIIALVVFFMVKAVNRIKRKQPAPAKPAELTAEAKLLSEIRDLLQGKR